MPRSNVAVVFIHVVGGIGAGKSTMLARAAANPSAYIATLQSLKRFSAIEAWSPEKTKLVVVVEDPTRWKSADGESLLDLRKSDPSRYATELQTTILRDRITRATEAVVASLKTLDSETEHVLVVTEGCVDVDHSVYARACFERGDMTDEQWREYDTIYGRMAGSWSQSLESLACEMLGADVSLAVGGTLFLSTPLQETQSRIKVRGRECEQSLPKEYLGDVIERHEFLLSSDSYPAKPVVAVVDRPLAESERIIENKE